MTISLFFLHNAIGVKLGLHKALCRLPSRLLRKAPGHRDSCQRPGPHLPGSLEVVLVSRVCGTASINLPQTVTVLLCSYFHGKHLFLKNTTREDMACKGKMDPKPEKYLVLLPALCVLSVLLTQLLVDLDFRVLSQSALQILSPGDFEMFLLEELCSSP